MKGFIEFKESKGGAKAGKLELIKINLDKAKAFAEDIFKKNNRDLEEELPDFDDNFIKAQRIAGGGFAQRKDMPVISNNDVKNLQRTLKKGEIDITKPFSSPVVANDPFPQGLDKGTGKSWLKSGIKRNDGDAKDDVVNVKIKKVSVGNLKPIQSQIYFDKSIKNVAEFGAKGTKDFAESKGNTFVVSKDNRIIDGHHRFLSALLVDPKIKVNCLEIDLPIKDLLPLTLSYTDAIGNVRNK
tara:strand:+ start:139 stop:861 length:723 start_codon:yes stop_codon:yes gene_type:complete